jgi:hypothetical protein
VCDYAEGGHERVRRIIGAVLIALLLIGMAVLGAWQLLGRGGGVALSRNASPTAACLRAARAVPTFTIKFGSADPMALTAVSELTGGKLFVVRGNGLAGAFKEVRAYQ